MQEWLEQFAQTLLAALTKELGQAPYIAGVQNLLLTMSLPSKFKTLSKKEQFMESKKLVDRIKLALMEDYATRMMAGI